MQDKMKLTFAKFKFRIFLILHAWFAPVAVVVACDVGESLDHFQGLEASFGIRFHRSYVRFLNNFSK